MTIEILPARLANQIAAGEVVERPASVIKELVENSLDAGATLIKIDVEKGGAKRLRIIDNGSGIAKEELTLALSRHATSKIKNLSDLEAISSLGFRGEALASISSVSRLTLTSKPPEQDTAWQASAEGRDMTVEVKPAAHANGTTIDVKDLFFNTPARRKFLRTEKTEFSHIEEVVRRIALARLDVTFILSHNEHIVRQYRAATTKTQQSKRVAQVCGQRFIDHAFEVDCQHNDIRLWGWLAHPDFARNQNDLCYSYVNGRMMRDRLINHAIRQAYANLLPAETYPAFVLFLQVDYREVDVNVHPAKHEVRFHQGRYVHDFIYSVCQQALAEQNQHQADILPQAEPALNESHFSTPSPERSTSVDHDQTTEVSYQQTRPDYVKPLTYVKEVSANQYQQHYHKNPPVSAQAARTYQQLMQPMPDLELPVQTAIVAAHDERPPSRILHLVDKKYAVIMVEQQLRLLSLAKLEQYVITQEIGERWQEGLVSQPLLLPIKLKLSERQIALVQQYSQQFEKLGLVIQPLDKTQIQIRQFPVLLRHKDVSGSFLSLLDTLSKLSVAQLKADNYWRMAFVQLMTANEYDTAKAESVINKAETVNTSALDPLLLLNSVVIDLTSEISQL